MPKPCPYCAGRRGNSLVLRCEGKAVNEAIRFHEAGHAVAAIACGGAVHAIRAHADDAGAAVSLTGSVIDLGVTVAAGPVAGNWSRRWIVGADTAELIASLDRAGAGMCGGCDACRLAALVFIGTSDDEIAQSIDLHRRIEHRALSLIRTPPVWRAIAELADALEAAGEIEGDAVHAVVARHFQPGAYSILHHPN